MRTQYHFLARIVIEATTPLNIGSGNKGIKTDSLVLRDVNGLPFIPGTTIAGLLRHSLSTDEDKKRLMGSKEGGSSLIITEAKMLNSDGKVLDGIVDSKVLESEFLKNYQQLPIRQHVKIGHRGATMKGGKFDEEIILKGTRFCFEMEMLSDNNNDNDFKQLIQVINSDTFRIGSGSRSGFGEVKIVSCKYNITDLQDNRQKKSYLDKSSSLSEEWEGFIDYSGKANSSEWIKYELELKPVDFILFGSGFGSKSADMTYVQESYVDWDAEPEGRIVKQDKVLLIPASSVKGALAHRVAFYYNKKTDAVILSDGTLKNGRSVNDVVGKNNDAVKAIFGSEGNNVDGKIIEKQRGNILISDVIRKKTPATKGKILNHVSIDRFTGGAIDGALFSEETLYANEEAITFSIQIHKQAFDTEGKIQASLEDAMKDICRGMLPLGGGVNRGNGCFIGKLIKNGELIYEDK